jgi:transcriptional regulator with XRE-family HTH domain
VTLGEYLKLGRQIKKLSLRDLEKKTGVSNALLSQWETDEGRAIKGGFARIAKVADVLGLSIAKCVELALAEYEKDGADAPTEM